MKNKSLYHIPRKYKKAEAKILQDDRDDMYNEMDNSIDNITGLTLQGLYDYKSDDYIIGLHRTASEKDDILKNGIVMRGNELTMHVQPFRNFPFLLREIKYCESYKMSNGCFIVKIPKKDVYQKDMDKTTEPIYYKDQDGNIRLRPEFVAAYVPVNNREIGNNYLLIHFYPIECKIAITDSNDNEDKIYGISNYNYDAFYTLITKDNFTSFKIKPLIYSLNEENKNIAYPLIINSIKINNNEVPELIINETEPILFYFKDNLTRLKLVYNYSNDGGTLIVSFYIKEKTRFKIECNDGKENINKIIYYKEHILIKPIPSKAQYNILITKIDPKDSVTIIKITGN